MSDEPNADGASGRRIGRRRFVRRAMGVVGAMAVPTGLYTWLIEPEWVEFVERDLPVRLLPGDLAGRTLVQLSDLHVGSVDEEYIAETFRRTAALGPDFVVFTGDFVTAGVADVESRLRHVLSLFPHGRLGTAAILGNHDYGFRWSQTKDAEAVIAVATAAGVPVLRNEALSRAGLQFVGLDDLWSGRFDPDSAFAAADPEAATLVLSHNPDTADLEGLQAYDGWILAGHTHGGQCKPPFLPPPILPVENRRYTAGEFDLAGSRRMYINRGVGHIFRVRFNVRPEVTVFRLRRA